jgi:hypothetical protein
MADKLAEALGDSPLGLHASRALMPLPLMRRFVVTGPTPLLRPGFAVVENDIPEAGWRVQSRSAFPPYGTRMPMRC